MQSGDSAGEQASGNRDGPNDWSDEPCYSVDLLRRVVGAGLESVRIVDKDAGVLKCRFIRINLGRCANKSAAYCLIRIMKII